MIDLKFGIINRMLVLSFTSVEKKPTINSFDKYYMPLVEIKCFNALIDNKLFFDQPVKKNNKSIWKTCQFVKKQKYKCSIEFIE